MNIRKVSTGRNDPLREPAGNSSSPLRTPSPPSTAKAGGEACFQSIVAERQNEEAAPPWVMEALGCATTDEIGLEQVSTSRNPVASNIEHRSHNGMLQTSMATQMDSVTKQSTIRVLHDRTLRQLKQQRRLMPGRWVRQQASSMHR